MIRDWSDKRVTVMGLGRFGGGVGVTRWLAAAGARVLVTDKAPAETLAASLELIADLGVARRLGGHEPRDFRETDLVVVNPAVPESSEFLKIAREAGVPMTTEVNLFVERCPARCIGVTGSVGKSTITAMIGHLLGKATKRRSDEASEGRGPRVWVGGNIGRSLLEGLGQIAGDDSVVLELSSFQLQRTPLVRWSPHVAVITSITPNHLDWHGGFEAYQSAKLNVAAFQDPRRAVLVIQNTPELCAAVEKRVGDMSRVWRYGLDDDTPVARRGDQLSRWDGLELGVPGRHNRENAAAALAVARALDVPDDLAVAGLASFEALPHRLQRVAERGGVTYYDDSKSTTPEAALTALRALAAPLLVILGGYDKGSDLCPLASEVARRTRYAACIGTTGQTLAQAVRAAGGQADYCGTLARAMTACRERAKPGDTVLLSPACASWDQFVDYRSRGEAFSRMARGLD